MSQAVIGILAHVDAGKTTLAEALLTQAGAVRTAGRVDRGTSHLDTDPMERARGITIFSATAPLTWQDAHLTLIDTPGHGDFAAEAERALRALDYAVLLVAANDGVTGHTRALWRLLRRAGIPTLVFLNKCDLVGAQPEAVTASLQERLGPGCVDWSLEQAERDEACALTDEAALDELLQTGALCPQTLRRLVREGSVTPVLRGSALRGHGVRELLDALASLAEQRPWPEAFGARVFNVTHDERGERLTWLKVTGGTLQVKSQLEGMRQGRPWAEKVDQARVYAGDRYQTVREVPAGAVCAVTGLSHVFAGEGLGAEPDGGAPVLQPVLSCAVELRGQDAHTVHQALEVLAQEDPLLQVRWEEETQELRLSLMGPIQQEVLAQQLRERFGLDVGFGPGRVRYRETVCAPVAGVGHFEPLRHYAEAHLLLEPLPPGSGLQAGSCCPLDDLDLNWQRLVLTHVLEREHRGVLTGAPLTDVRVTLTAGKAHAKHTEGGDFRQATYRAVRQALMTAREAGACVLLEPWLGFCLEVPEASLGRALSDLQRMGARVEAPAVLGGVATLEGALPASELGDYPAAVAAYTGGEGRMSCEFCGYEPCHDAERVIAEAAYDPEADLAHTPDSVFCSHGAGRTVKWADVPAAAHVAEDPGRRTPWRPADEAFFGRGRYQMP